MIKKADIILCTVFIILGITAFFLLTSTPGENVRIKHHGETVYFANLHIDHEIIVEGEYTNHIKIENGAAYYESSDCPGEDCVHMGSASDSGRTLACAPNSTIVIIEGHSEVDGIAE